MYLFSKCNCCFFLLLGVNICVTWTVALEANRACGACATGALSPGRCHPHLSAHASPPRASVGHGGGLPPWATLVRLIRHVGGVPAAPLGARLHPDPAVWPAVCPLHLVSWPGLLHRCGGRVLLCIRHRLGTRTHTHMVRFITEDESVFYEMLLSASQKHSILWPQPSCCVILPASTLASPVQLLRAVWTHQSRTDSLVILKKHLCHDGVFVFLWVRLELKLKSQV